MSFLAGLAGLSANTGMNVCGQLIDYNLNKRLMRYQQQLNEETAQNNDKRQRALMSDSDTIAKQSLRNAGVNTALNGSTSVAGSTTAPTADGVSGASVSGLSNLGNTGMDAFYRFQSMDKENDVKESVIDSNKASAHAAESQAENQDIKNGFEIDNQIANLEKLHKENKISDAEYELRMENLKRMQDTHEDYVKTEHEKANQSEIETRISTLREKGQQIQNEIATITKDINSEQLKQVKFETDHMAEKFVKEMDVLSSQIRANDAASAASYASSAESRARKLGIELENKLTAAKVPHAKELASAYTDQYVNAAKLAYEQYRGQKLDNENIKNSRGSWSKVSSARDKIVYGANTAGDILRGLLGGLVSGSVSKAIK